MITGYSWDFGDGVSSNTANPSHAYNDAGVFTATLTVTDDFGDTGTDAVTINVSQPTSSIVFSANGYREKGVKKVVFDRSGYKYHGVIKALADAARKNGLEF